ncbi:MAG: hypothetical protein HYY37_02260 [Candidatus Aenigmarchaeota archaeon]|nr:hypothetical protein [Candidatus Aenigmarchaeota archaeon]
MFCIVCGRTATKGTFCDACFLKHHPLFSLEDFIIYACGDCGAYHEGAAAKRTDIDDVLRTAIEKHLKEGNNVAIRFSITKRQGTTLFVTVTGTGFLSGLRKTETHAIKVRLKKRTCERCIRIAGGYYEAVIQLRGNEPEKMLHKLEGSLPKGARIERIQGGYNVKFVAKNEAERAIKGLKQYTIKRSFKLVGEKKGKSLIRNFYSVR